MTNLFRHKDTREVYFNKHESKTITIYVRPTLTFTAIMGKYRKKRKQGRHGGGGNAKKHHKKDNSKWNNVPIDRNNVLFEEYYTKQPDLLKSHEWKAFVTALRKPLPATFRINGTCTNKEQLKKHLRTTYSFELGDVKVDNHMIAPPRPLAWYPDNNGWQLGCGRKVLRKSETLKKIHRFIVEETERGNVSRQESVSMIPPYLLQVKPEHYVLDMCAAPGSKTAQLLEFLAGEDNLTVPGGMVIANDNDSRRAYMLTHQVKRIKSAGLVVSCHDAQFFPNLIPREFAAKQQNNNDSRYAEGIFDRILCDVPCSGDGTMRKNVDVWRKWDTMSGIALHPLQIQIAMRGVSLLKVGGLMVYSTCSFNPVENEAVVAEILVRCGGAVELVDASDMLPSLIRRPGLYNWKVAVQKKKPEVGIVWVDSHDKRPELIGQHLRPGMFPPTMEKAKELNLQHCWRMMPHDQDTGGFFVALLRKTKEIPGPSGSSNYKVKTTSEKGKNVVKAATSKDKSKDETTTAAASKTTVDESKNKNTDAKPLQNKKHPERAGGQDLYSEFLINDANRESWKSMKSFYGIKDTFPENLLFTRSVGAKMISFVNKTVRDYAMDFDNKGRRLHLVNVGLKVFEKNSRPGVDCAYRLQQDGIAALLPYLTKRVVDVNFQDMLYLLQNSERGFPVIAMSDEASKVMKNLTNGSCVLRLNTSEFESEKVMNDAGIPSNFCIVCWRGDVALSPLVQKNEKSSLYNQIVSAGKNLGKEILDLKDFVYPEKKKE